LTPAGFREDFCAVGVSGLGFRVGGLGCSCLDSDVCIHIHIHVYIYTHICIYTYTYIYMYTCICIHVDACIHVYMQLCRQGCYGVACLLLFRVLGFGLQVSSNGAWGLRVRR